MTFQAEGVQGSRPAHGREQYLKRPRFELGLQGPRQAHRDFWGWGVTAWRAFQALARLCPAGQQHLRLGAGAGAGVSGAVFGGFRRSGEQKGGRQVSQERGQDGAHGSLELAAQPGSQGRRRRWLAPILSQLRLEGSAPRLKIGPDRQGASPWAPEVP